MRGLFYELCVLELIMDPGQPLAERKQREYYKT